MELSELIDRIEQWKQGGTKSAFSQNAGPGAAQAAAAMFESEDEEAPGEFGAGEGAFGEEAEMDEEDYEIDGEDLTSEDDET